MKNTTYTSIDSLPITLNADDIASILGLSRAGAYRLFKMKGFPVLSLGRKRLVSKEKFIRWIDDNSGQPLIHH